MAHWTSGALELVMRNEPTYTFGRQPPPAHVREHVFGDASLLSSKHALACLANGQPAGAAVLGATGGASGVHPHSALIIEKQCFVAVGSYVACLALPDLALVWSLEVDSATCFGLHATREEHAFISHGELAIAKLTTAGEILWSAGGADIFSEPIEVTADAVLATDFEGRRYRMDLRTGLSA